MSDAEEWKQFQADLLISVRVANDFPVTHTSNRGIYITSKSLSDPEKIYRMRNTDTKRIPNHYLLKRKSLIKGTPVIGQTRSTLLPKFS